MTQFVRVNIEGLKRFASQIGSGGPAIKRALKQAAARYRGFLQEQFDANSKGGGGWPPLALSTILRRRTGKGKGKKVSAFEGLEATGEKTKVKTWGQLRRYHREKAYELSEKQNALGARLHMAKTDRQRASLERQMDATRKKAAKNLEDLKAVKKSIRMAVGGVAGSGVSILRDTGILFNALSPTFSGAPGAIEEQIENGLRVGYGGPARHTGKGSKVSIADIAAFHQEGVGRLPVRQIIVPPTPAVADAMTGYVQKAVDQIARDTNI